jgi:GNAT superfamily N-acetyltransferase
MAIIYRPTRPEELPATDALVVASINDLTQRHGFGPMASSSPPAFQLFCLQDDPRGLWTAEDTGDIIGFAWSWACENLWFLAQLFVQPGMQGKGIGETLLKRTLHHANLVGASTRALITFAFNTVSQGLYLRHGLLPRCPVYSFSAPHEVVASRIKPARLSASRLDGGADHIQRLASIDRQVLGASREKHHAYLANDGSSIGFALHAGGEWLGYVYLSPSGHIGPLAVADRADMAQAFETALNLAMQTRSPQISALVPALAIPALVSSLDHGLRIRFPMLLMSDRAMDRWDSYLPRNPGFM